MKVIIENIDAMNTNKVTATAVKLFWEYIELKARAETSKISGNM